MLDLRDLIIQRIDQCQRLSDRTKDYLTDSAIIASLDSQIQTNRTILKLFAHSKSRQKYRVKMQEQLLQDLKNQPLGNAKAIDQFYRVSIGIFTKYNLALFPHKQKGLSTVERLQKLYHTFIETNQSLKISKDTKAALQFSNEKSIITLIEWVCSWSKSFLNNCIQLAISNEFQRHEDQMKRIGNLKSSSLLSHKQKARSTFPSLFLTNKESVYSLFHQDLINYYKYLPFDLDLDTSFLKTIRKTYPKGHELVRDQNLRKAAEILIQSTNKVVRDSIQSFRMQYVNYFERCLIINQQNVQSQDIHSSSLKKIVYQQPIKRGERRYNRKVELQRIKSQSNGNNRANRQYRNSLLLCPKANEISFQSSKEIMKKIQRKKQKQKQHRQQVQLPQITQGKSSGSQERSSAMRNKPVYNFCQSNNRSLISNYQKMPKSPQEVPKFFKFESHQPLSIEKLFNKGGFSYPSKEKQQIFSQQELKGRKDEGQELKRNRQLMLRLLRQKSKHVFLQK